MYVIGTAAAKQRNAVARLGEAFGSVRATSRSPTIPASSDAAMVIASNGDWLVKAAAAGGLPINRSKVMTPKAGRIRATIHSAKPAISVLSKTTINMPVATL